MEECFCPRCKQTKLLDDFPIRRTKKNGHYTYCKICSTELAKNYYHSHREQGRLSRRRYRAKNLEKLQQYDRERYNEPERRKQCLNRAFLVRNLRDPEVWNDYFRKWCKTNREKIRVYQQNRRTRSQSNVLTLEEWTTILLEHNYRCHYCGIDGILTMDHVTPLARGGAHIASNIVPACKRCNSRKGAKTKEEFFLYMEERYGKENIYRREA